MCLLEEGNAGFYRFLAGVLGGYALDVFHTVTLLHVLEPLEYAIVDVRVVPAVCDDVDRLGASWPLLSVLFAVVAAIVVEALDEGVGA